MKHFFLLLSILILNKGFGQDKSRIFLKGNAKLLTTWSWKTEKSVSSLLASGDKLTVKMQAQLGIEVLLTHKNIPKRLISIEESEELYIQCFEYDFDGDGSKELIIASSPDFAALNVYVFKYSNGFSELVGNFGSTFEIILEKNVILLPLGSQGLGNEYCYRNGAFYELIYHDPKVNSD
jgi:hypothetical protein